MEHLTKWDTHLVGHLTKWDTIFGLKARKNLTKRDILLFGSPAADVFTNISAIMVADYLAIRIF